MDEFASQVVSSVIIPLLPLLQGLLAALIGLGIYKLKQRIKEDQIDRYLDILQDLVINVVGQINQTAIDSLKELQAGKLTPEQKDLYFGMAQEKIMSQITAAQTKVLQEVYNDLDAYVSDLIESVVRQQKAL